MIDPMQESIDPLEPKASAQVRTGPRFCGVRQSVIEEARRRQLQWVNKRRLAWCIADRLPGHPLDALTATFSEALAAWQRVCGLVFYQVLSPAQADLIILTRPIDGASGTLAEHELPPGNDQPLRGWFDLGERWHVGTTPAPADRVDLLAVATHEFGHGIGISHEETRGTTALMDPWYSPQIRTPQPWDIAQAVERYGGPVEEPKPPVEPPKELPDSLPMVVNVLNAVYSGSLSRKL